jgi:cob(I)alamin adenosyltransferase
MGKSNIYTRSGDSGTTSLVGGQRVAKTDARLEAYGTVDELNAQLGLLRYYLDEADDRDMVLQIQNTLFVVGSYLATDEEHHEVMEASVMYPDMVSDLEAEIDRIDAMLPPCKGFIIPGGTRASAIANVCRTVCRRAERRILAVEELRPSAAREAEPSASENAELVFAFMNRLSDYLFVLGRKLNFLTHREENIWVKRT